MQLKAEVKQVLVVVIALRMTSKARNWVNERALSVGHHVDTYFLSS